MTIEPSTNYANYLLKQLTCAGLRAKLMVAEIDCVTVALEGDFIGTDDAEMWLHEAGLFGLIDLSSAAIAAST